MPSSTFRLTGSSSTTRMLALPSLPSDGPVEGGSGSWMSLSADGVETDSAPLVSISLDIPSSMDGAISSDDMESLASLASASASGRLNEKTEPAPGSELTDISPPCSSTSCLHMLRPSPNPRPSWTP